jgi:hypothetical protein
LARKEDLKTHKAHSFFIFLQHFLDGADAFGTGPAGVATITQTSLHGEAFDCLNAG